MGRPRSSRRLAREAGHSGSLLDLKMNLHRTNRENGGLMGRTALLILLAGAVLFAATAFEAGIAA